VTDTSSTIFVVDDDDFVRDALEALLKSAGFKVEVFESAKAFLISDYDNKKALLVLDVQMPGMTGLELQKHLADTGVAIPIVFITAHEDNQAHAKAMAAGAVAFLQKPFEDFTLLDAINLGQSENSKCKGVVCDQD
jgi:FixJ family two-component response regulator